MKKILFFAGAAMSALALGACSGNNCSNCNACSGPGTCNLDEDKVYTGVLPAADAGGIRYTLKLDYDDDKNFMEGDYDLLETYIVGDSVSATGYKDAGSFRSEGDFTVMKGDGANSGKTYIKLVQDPGESSKGSDSGPLYFLVESDSTLVMVNAELQESTIPGLNYTLKIVK